MDVPAFFAHQHLRAAPLPRAGAVSVGPGEHRVLLELRVDRRGRVRHVEALSGDERLGAPAAAAARNWRYDRFLRFAAEFRTQAVVSFQDGEFAVVTPTAPPSSSRRLSVSKAEMTRRLVSSPPFEYSYEARSNRIEGVTRARVIVGANGRVREVSVIEGPPVLSSEVHRVIQQSTYVPYLDNGELVDVETEVVMHIRLAY